MISSPALELIDVVNIRARRPILDHISFCAHAGRITGLVGENGAGKSSAFRVLLGLERPSTGQALIYGKPYASYPQPLCMVGAVLDGPGAHPHRSAYTHLRWLAASQGIEQTRIDEVLEIVGLSTVAKQRVGSFSLGMNQRLAIGAAMLGDPKVYVLDEPFNGLDPQAIRLLRGLMHQWAKAGAAVLVSSHLIGELAGIADDLVVMAQGKVVTTGTVASIQGEYPSLEDAYFALTDSRSVRG